MFSDGICEAMNAEGETFGEDRLLTIVQQCFDQTPADIRNAIMSGVHAHTRIATPPMIKPSLWHVSKMCAPPAC